ASPCDALARYPKPDALGPDLDAAARLLHHGPPAAAHREEVGHPEVRPGPAYLDGHARFSWEPAHHRPHQRGRASYVDYDPVSESGKERRAPHAVGGSRSDSLDRIPPRVVHVHQRPVVLGEV